MSPIYGHLQSLLKVLSLFLYLEELSFNFHELDERFWCCYNSLLKFRPVTRLPGWCLKMLLQHFIIMFFFMIPYILLSAPIPPTAANPNIMLLLCTSHTPEINLNCNLFMFWFKSNGWLAHIYWELFFLCKMTFYNTFYLQLLYVCGCVLKLVQLFHQS